MRCSFLALSTASEKGLARCSTTPNTPPGLSTSNADLNTAASVAGLWLSQSCALRKVSTISAEFGAPRFTLNGGAKSITFSIWPNTAGLALILSANFGEPASIRWPWSARNGARISVYQPPAGSSSITVMSGLMPKNCRVWTGWRERSRALLAAERQAPSAAFCSCAVTGVTGGVAAQATPGSRLAANRSRSLQVGWDMVRASRGEASKPTPADAGWVGRWGSWRKADPHPTPLPRGEGLCRRGGQSRSRPRSRASRPSLPPPESPSCAGTLVGTLISLSWRDFSLALVCASGPC